MDPLERQAREVYLTTLDRIEQILILQDQSGYKPPGDQKQKLVSNLRALLDCGFRDIETRARILLDRAGGESPEASFLRLLEKDLPLISRGEDGVTFRLLYGTLSPAEKLQWELKHDAQLFAADINREIWSTPCCGWRSISELNGRTFPTDLRKAIFNRIKKAVKRRKQGQHPTERAGVVKRILARLRRS